MSALSWLPEDRSHAEHEIDLYQERASLAFELQAARTELYACHAELVDRDRELVRLRRTIEAWWRRVFYRMAELGWPMGLCALVGGFLAVFAMRALGL